MEMTHATTTRTIDFNNSGVAFAAKTDRELKLAYWLFKLVSHPWMVKIGGRIAMAAVKVGLPVNSLIRHTLYHHFCGGETLLQAEQVMHKLANQKVQTVLDYAAEAQETE